jgi:hypothetical protein
LTTEPSSLIDGKDSAKRSFIYNPTSLLIRDASLLKRRIKYAKRKKSPLLIQPEWDQTSHLDLSHLNSVRHEVYRNFFDKEAGSYDKRDVFKYKYKTPSSGKDAFMKYKEKDSLYWDNRIPMIPNSKKTTHNKILENYFN